MGKHSEHTNKDKNKKIKFKKIFIIIVSVIVALVIFKICYKNINKKQIENMINETFIALKENNVQEVNKTMNYNDIINALDKDMLNEKNLKENELDRAFFENLKWNINNITKNEEEIIVNIEITNKDYKTIILNWLKEILNEENINNDLTDEICIKKLKEVAFDKNIPEKTVTKYITLKKQEEWRIIVDNELINGIFPGIEAINSIIEEI